MAGSWGLVSTAQVEGACAAAVGAGELPSEMVGAVEGLREPGTGQGGLVAWILIYEIGVGWLVEVVELWGWIWDWDWDWVQRSKLRAMRLGFGVRSADRNCEVGTVRIGRK